MTFIVACTISAAPLRVIRVRLQMGSRTCGCAGAIAIGDYTEAAAVVVLFGLAEWLEARAAGHSCDFRRVLSSFDCVCTHVSQLDVADAAHKSSSL